MTLSWNPPPPPNRLETPPYHRACCACVSLHIQSIRLSPVHSPVHVKSPLNFRWQRNTGDGRTMSSFGGYDCQLAKPPPSTLHTKCPICLLLLRDPYQATCCGKHFCRSCSQRLQAVDSDHRCPTCRKANVNFVVNNDLQHSLNQLHVLCTNSKDGCKWKGKLGKLEHHLNEVHSSELSKCEDESHRYNSVMELSGIILFPLIAAWRDCIK